MKPILRKIDHSPDFSFSIREDIHPYLYNHWHYHPEAELTLIRKGKGLRLVGDHMQSFEDGDLIFLGPGLPHMWRSDHLYFKPHSNLTIEAIAIHFDPNFWGDDFLKLPEMNTVSQLLKRASRGIMITGNSKLVITSKMERILSAKGISRVTRLLELLDLIASSADVRYLSSSGFVNTYNASNTERINQIFTYTFAHFRQPISINEIADAVNISPNSFCRYFKTRTLKTYWQFLMEVRIGYACKLLIENKLSISQICYESGFNNLSNFNRQFKAILQMPPQQYARIYALPHAL